MDLGIESITDIPDDADLTALQARVCDSVCNGKPYATNELAGALKEPKFPIHHLDFETFMLAVPRYIGTRPYQTLPFQWSNHIQSRNGTVRHEEYLCREDEDPRQEFAETLLATLGEKGSICIYTTYEVRIIRELAEALPKLRRRLQALEDRVWDLKAVIKDHYYHPDFHGSFSLKAVLRAVVPSMSYDSLAIQDGNAASRAHLEAILTDDADRRRELQDGLLEYCGQDTVAMVKLREALADGCA